MKTTMMKKGGVALALAMSAMLTGCATAPKTLYQWDGYQPQVYQYLKGESPEQQIAEMEKSLALISARDFSISAICCSGLSPFRYWYTCGW